MIVRLCLFSFAIVSFSLCPVASTLIAQVVAPAPDRREGEGLGPFPTLVIKDAILIDGTGAPPRGPVTIVIKENRIDSITSRRSISDADHVIDAKGMYVMPGFVDMHAHCGGRTKAPEAEYVYKLWMAHGVTTVRGVPLGPNDWTVKEKERSANNEIVAPRIVNYQRPGNPQTVEEAREWVRQAPLNGIDGLKLGAYRPEIMEALITEAQRLGLGTTAHLAQTGVAQMDAMDAARLGLDTVTHYYGHFEALLADYTVQPWPTDYNYNDEQDRFSQVARLWDKIHPPGSPEWDAYLREHLELGTVFDPTMTIYAAGRDVMRARNAEWHDKYTLPSLFQFFEPSLQNHGSYWFYWTTEDEVAWRNFYHRWMRLINDYKKMGGRVTVGSDSGFIYKTYGFGYIEELELLQEAGFHPLEVIQAATMNGALTMHEPSASPLEYGVVRPGLLADLAIVDANPLENLKVLYGTGAIKLDRESGEVIRVGGVQWTIKDGIVYDAKQLLADVAAMVEKQKSDQLVSVAANEPSDQPAPNQVAVQAAADETAADLPADPLVTDHYVMVLDLESDRAMAYSKQHGVWARIQLPAATAGSDRFEGGNMVACLRRGQRVYAYSSAKNRWDVLAVGEDEDFEMTVHDTVIVVTRPNRVEVFGNDSGLWNGVSLSDQP